MKKYLAITSIMTVTLISISCSAGFASGSSTQNLPQDTISTNQQTDANLETGLPKSTEVVTTIENSLLSVDEAGGLVYMREEEKLAHDLYLSFYENWGLPIFQNIASSEQTHMESVALLLDRYGIPDPTDNNPTGVFTDSALQDLYDQLLAQGTLSVSEALKAGAAVEEVDIQDLRDRFAQTSQADILQVYQNLEMGSRNHLRSFTSVLENQTGESYSPIYLTADEYQQIISSGIESYGQGTGGGNSRGGPRNN